MSQIPDNRDETAAEHYGIEVKRNGMACCPFHDDRTPSMKVDKRFHCFGCQEDGDVIDFVGKLFGLSPKRAADGSALLQSAGDQLVQQILHIVHLLQGFTEQGMPVLVLRARTADEQFLLSKRQYEHMTGRRQKHDVIAYQIRQSFKPGDVTSPP